MPLNESLWNLYVSRALCIACFRGSASALSNVHPVPVFCRAAAAGRTLKTDRPWALHEFQGSRSAD